MLRFVNQIRIRSFNPATTINCIKQIRCYNQIHHHSIKLLSTSKLTNELLDDSEELDPELIESYPAESEIDPSMRYENENLSAEHLTPEQYKEIQQYYMQLQQEEKNNNGQSQIPLPHPIKAQSKLSLEEIQNRQKKVWTSMSNTLQGIWESMDSIDKTNIKRIDKVFGKLEKLESLHVKNIQHSLHHIAMLRDEVSTVNTRINNVFQRLSDLEKTSPSEWLEWSVPKFEIPFEDGVYLRSPGYEVGSMIWCIELRWETDEIIQDLKEHDADIREYNDNESNPIIDIREDQENNDDDDNNKDESKGGEYERINTGYRRLGIYVSPRSVANWERLSSLKATCEIRVNENDYSDAISIIREENEDNKDSTMNPPDKTNKKQQHFSISGEFLRGKKLTSWGRTISNGDDFFDKTKIDDEISIKLRIINQTLTYQQYADDKKDDIVSGSISEKDIEIETQKPEFSNFDFSDKKSTMLKKQKQDDMNADIESQVQHYMNIPINEFWNIFSEEVESGKSKEGHSFSYIAKACKLDLNLISIFRKGPITNIDDDDDDDKTKKKRNDENKEEFKNLNAKQRDRRKQHLLKRKLGQSKKWEMIVEYDLKNPDFRRKLATFLVKHQYKKRRNLRSKSSF